MKPLEYFARVQYKTAVMLWGSNHKTDFVDDDDSPDVSEEEAPGEDLPTTTNHLSKMYSLSTIENFYLNKAERIDRTLTMVGWNVS